MKHLLLVHNVHKQGVTQNGNTIDRPCIPTSVAAHRMYVGGSVDDQQKFIYSLQASIALRMRNSTSDATYST